jgi:hypothetical protein
MMLETPKAEGKAKGAIEVDPLDEQYLNTLRRLIQAGGAGGAGEAGGTGNRRAIGNRRP